MQWLQPKLTSRHSGDRPTGRELLKTKQTRDVKLFTVVLELSRTHTLREHKVMRNANGLLGKYGRTFVSLFRIRAHRRLHAMPEILFASISEHGTNEKGTRYASLRSVTKRRIFFVLGRATCPLAFITNATRIWSLLADLSTVKEQVIREQQLNIAIVWQCCFVKLLKFKTFRLG